MEADQNQEVPEVQAVETEPPAPEQPQSEQVNETPVQDPDPEPVEASTAEVESEKPPEDEPAQEKAETPKESESVAAAAEQVTEQAVEVQKCAEEKSESEVVQQVSEAAAPEKKTDEKPAEDKVEPAEAAKVEAAATEPAAATEAQAEPKKEAEAEKPSEAPVVQAEAPKEAEASPKEAEASPKEAEAPPKEAEAPPKQVELPLFYGWFLLAEVEEKIKCSTMDFLKTLDTLEAFKKHISEFTGEPDKEVDLEQYFQTQGPLHCTTKFCDYGKVEGSKEYSELQVVKESDGNSTELSVTGLIVTPRTFGARVALTTEQLPLWPAGADKEGVPAAELPAIEALEVGSRAHVTLGCAPNVEAVQTGLDLLEILVFLKGEKEAVAVEELELGTLSYLGQGRWYLALREAVTCDANFSSFSEKVRPAEPGKKEGGEKKKKPKCAIL